MTNAAAIAFNADLEALLAIVQQVGKKAYASKATIDWNDALEPYDEYLAKESPETWRTTFAPAMAGVVSGVGDHWATELGVQFNLRNILAESWFEDYSLTFAQPINETTSAAVHDIIAQAQAEGWSNPELQQRLQQNFRQWSDGDVSPEDLEWLNARKPDYRAEMIARTETTRSANAGAAALFNNWGVEEKIWSTSVDGRERESHRNVNGVKVKVKEAFNVGGHRMMYPGDASLGAPPSEFVNCRCGMLPGDLLDEEVDETATVTQVSNDVVYLGRSDLFGNDDFYNKWKTHLEGMPEKEIDAIKQYTTNAYKSINEYVRTGMVNDRDVSPTSSDKLSTVVNRIDSAMQKSVIDDNLTVYRGVGNSFFGEDVKARGPQTVNDLREFVGTVVNSSSYSSTSIDYDNAVQFMNGKVPGTAILLEIRVPSGSHGIYIDPVSRYREFEMLLDRNSNFLVTAVDYNEKGILTAFVDLLPS